MYPKRLSIDGGKEILMAVRRGLASRWRLHAGLVEITSKNTCFASSINAVQIGFRVRSSSYHFVGKNYHFALFKKHVELLQFE